MSYWCGLPFGEGTGQPVVGVGVNAMPTVAEPPAGIVSDVA